jgi:hypothetical protein
MKLSALSTIGKVYKNGDDVVYSGHAGELSLVVSKLGLRLYANWMRLLSRRWVERSEE